MSNAGNDDETQITFRCPEELEEQSMMAYRKAAVENHAPPDGVRSDALRQLMRALVKNPEIIKYGSKDCDEGSEWDLLRSI